MNSDQIKVVQVKRLLEQREMYADKPDMVEMIDECLTAQGWISVPVQA